LLNHPDLRGDVYFCVQRETLSFVAGLQKDGSVRKLECAAQPPAGDTATIYSRPSA
jgi:hypothetical protein